MTLVKRLFAVIAVCSVGAVLFSGCNKAEEIKPRTDNAEMRKTKNE